jgi:hypothetical protein
MILQPVQKTEEQYNTITKIFKILSLTFFDFD